MVHLRSQRGHSLTEMLAAVFLLAILAIATGPPLIEALRSSRLSAASRQIAAEVQHCRSRAVGTGWQYRIIGLSSGSSGANSNQYRLMSRESSGVTWPALTDPSITTSTLVVEDWVNLETAFPGVAINPGNPWEFALTFDSRGNPIEKSLNFEPLQLQNEYGKDSWLSVSATGSVVVD